MFNRKQTKIAPSYDFVLSFVSEYTKGTQNNEGTNNKNNDQDISVIEVPSIDRSSETNVKP